MAARLLYWEDTCLLGYDLRTGELLPKEATATAPLVNEGGDPDEEEEESGERIEQKRRFLRAMALPSQLREEGKQQQPPVAEVRRWQETHWQQRERLRGQDQLQRSEYWRERRERREGRNGRKWRRFL